MRYFYIHFKALIPVMLLTYIPALAILIGIVFLGFATGRHLSFFTEHPFASSFLPFYAGMLTYVDIILWCATAAICFFSAAVLKGDAMVRDWRFFLIVSGLFTSLLMCDNLFQMHIFFYPVLFHLSTYFVYGAYGLFVLWYLLYFKKQILETEFLLLSFSLVFFALAIIFDALPILPRGSTSFSDGLKLFGIVNWLVYFSRTCRNVVNKRSIIN
jgi:hypothetical protein